MYLISVCAALGGAERYALRNMYDKRHNVKAVGIKRITDMEQQAPRIGTHGRTFDWTSHRWPSRHICGKRRTVMSMTLPPFANTTSQELQTLLHIATAEPLLSTELYNLLVNKK